jgi:hypothetical protein
LERRLYNGVVEGRDVFEARRHAISDLQKTLKPNEFIGVTSIESWNFYSQNHK